VNECDSLRGPGLDIGCIHHLYTRPGTTSNHSATANLHNSQMTTAPAKPFTACCVFTKRSLATASNSGDSSASALKSSLHSLPYKIDLVDPFMFLLTPLHGPSRKHSFQEYLYCCMRICWHDNVFTEPLPRNGPNIFAYLATIILWASRFWSQ
jgi:hypothetical protein